TFELTAEQQRSERFNQAVQQLGSHSQISRIAAMASLGSVLRGQDREPALQVLLSYLRATHRAHGTTVNLDKQAPRDCSRPAASAEPDLQAAMDLIIAQGALSEPQHDLSFLDLGMLEAASANLSGARLDGAVLTAARLDHARLD